MNKSYIRILFVAVISGLILGIDIVRTRNVYDLSDIVLRVGLGQIELAPAYMATFFEYYFPLILFQYFSGVMIYKRFNTACVYYFSRVPNKNMWLAKEFLKLYVFTLLYLIVLVCSVISVSTMINGVGFSRAGFVLLGYYLVIHGLWLFGVSVLINAFAIKFGSITGFMICSFVQLGAVGALSMLSKVCDFSERENIEHKAFLLKLDPISHLVISWHSSKNSLISGMINMFEINFDLWLTVKLMLCFCTICCVVGFFLIKSKDLIENEIEL